MPTTPTHRHSLNNIVGYNVRRSINNIGERADLLVVTVDGAENYSNALAEATAIRTLCLGQTWAVVDNIYDCGCTSLDI